MANKIVSADVLNSDLSKLTVEHLEDSKKILSTKSEEGFTPLHVAVITSNQKLVLHLIAVGADPKAVDADGRTPLHWSAFRDVSFRVFESIARVSKNQGLEQTDRYGKTPLHYVCLNKTTGLFDNNVERDIHETLQKLQFLLMNSENIEQKDVEGNTPLLLLCKNIHNFATFEEISHNEVRGILGNSQSKCRSACGFTVEMFLKRGANIITQNDYGVSPLHVACKTNCVEIIRTLISQLQHLSALPTDAENSEMEIIGHSRDACGNTPMLSVFKAHVCKSLKYDTQAPSPWFYLDEFKQRFQDSLRPILKNMKSSVNIPKSASGSTVLHYALVDCLSSSDVVKGLIGYGKADVNARNVLGKTPLHFAILSDLTFNPEEIRELLIQNRQRKVHLLLENGAELNAKDCCGCTPLHDAVLAGDENLVELLLQNKADVNATNKYDDTPLHFADFCEKDSEIVNTIKCHLRNAMERREPNQTQAVSEETTSHCIVEKEELLQQNVDESQAESHQDTYLYPIYVNEAERWFQENARQWTLTDQKIQELLETSKSKSLSNDTSQNVVLSQAINLMKAVFQDVEKLDPRFKVSIELSGSTREGSKVDKPDEFDMLCFLEGFQTICNIEEIEPGYVQCKLSDSEDSATFAEFFDDCKFLNGSKLTSSLYCNIKKSLGHSHVWTTAPGLTLDRENHEYEFEDQLLGVLCLHLLYTDENYRYMEISIDVVPAIRKQNWWPSSARQTGELITSSIKNQGCMVITKPRIVPTLSGEKIKFLTQFKVSVYLSECSVLTSLPEEIRDAYKLAKILFRRTDLYPPLCETQEKDTCGETAEHDYIPDFLEMNYHPTVSYLKSSFTSYMLKNALLYELDEESQRRKFSPDKVDIKDPSCIASLDEKEIKEPPCNVTRRWTARIFRRLLNFSRSDSFLPYFLPTNTLFVKRGPNTLTDIQGTLYKVIIAILEGRYEN